MALTEQQLKHIKTWQACGSSQTAYCQTHGLNKKTFSRWFSNYQTLSQAMAPSLIAIDITQPITIPPEIHEPLRLRLANGLSLELPVNTSPRWLAELLQCLG